VVSLTRRAILKFVGLLKFLMVPFAVRDLVANFANFPPHADCGASLLARFKNALENIPQIYIARHAFAILSLVLLRVPFRLTYFTEQSSDLLSLREMF